MYAQAAGLIGITGWAFWDKRRKYDAFSQVVDGFMAWRALFHGKREILSEKKRNIFHTKNCGISRSVLHIYVHTCCKEV